MEDRIRIIDTGSGNTKCGNGNSILPENVFPTIVGVPKIPGIMVGMGAPDMFIGHDAVKRRGILKLKYCVEHSVVTNWLHYEKIIGHAMSLLRSPDSDEKDTPSVIMPIPALTPQANLEKLITMLFSTFNCKSVLLESSPVTSLYSYGKSSGIALESGDGVTMISPVYEGTLMPHGSFRLNIAGRDITDQLIRNVQEVGVEMTTSRARVIAKRIKEKHCKISFDPPYNRSSETSNSMEIIPLSSKERKELELPDGQQLKLGDALWRAPECLYTPKYLGSSMPGLSDTVWSTMYRVPPDMRVLLGKNIVLCGGNTLIEGFKERTERDVSKMTFGGIVAKVWDRPEEKIQHYASYVGCRILSKLGSSCELFATRKDYEEFGVKGLAKRKFFNGIGGELKCLWEQETGQEKDLVERMEMLGEKKVREEILKLRFVNLKIGVREKESIVVIKLLLVLL